MMNDGNGVFEYYEHRRKLEEEESEMATKKSGPLALAGKMDLKTWNQRIELIFSENVICYKFLEVKALSKGSQGHPIQSIVAVALPGGKL